MDDRIFKAPDGNALRFFEEAIKNNFQSEAHGRPLFDNMVYVEVMTPGSNESIPRFEVERTYCPEAGKGKGPYGRMVERTQYYERYKQAFEQYRAEEDGIGVEGTPLDQWSLLDKGTAASFKALGIFSVEMLANVADGNLGNLGTGGMTLREQARQHLQSRQFGIPTAQLAAEKSHLEAEVTRLTRELADANATITQFTTLKAAKPGKAQPEGQPPAELDALGMPVAPTGSVI